VSRRDRFSSYKKDELSPSLLFHSLLYNIEQVYRRVGKMLFVVEEDPKCDLVD